MYVDSPILSEAKSGTRESTNKDNATDLIGLKAFSKAG